MRTIRCFSLVLAFLLACLTGCSGRFIDWENKGAPSGTGFLTKEFQFRGNTQKYTVFIPHNYSSQAHYPVIMFLHGVLESGSNGQKCVTVGIGPAVNERAATFQFVVVFPQSTGDWESEDRAQLALATLDQVLKDYPAADRDRVTVTGLSNGGDGTWSIGAAHSDRFAALVPMCGKGSYDDVPKLTHIPIWCFHNKTDPFRSSGNAAEMVKRIQAAGGNAKITIYSEFGHDVWTRAYREGDVFAWMAAQRRGGTAP